MSNVIRMHRTGGPEVLEFEAIELAEPGPGQGLAPQARETTGSTLLTV